MSETDEKHVPNQNHNEEQIINDEEVEKQNDSIMTGTNAEHDSNDSDMQMTESSDDNNSVDDNVTKDAHNTDDTKNDSESDAKVDDKTVTDSDAANNANDTDVTVSVTADKNSDNESQNADETDSANTENKSTSNEDTHTESNTDENQGNGNSDSNSSDNARKPKTKRKIGKPAKVGIIACVAGLALGGVTGYYLLPHVQSGELAGKSSLTTNEFDKVIATYDFKGHNYTITAAEVADYAGLDYGKNENSNDNSNSSNDNENDNVNASNENKTYDIPSTEETVEAIRDKILTKEMDDKKIEASDDAVKEYAKTTYGSDDFDSLAAQYSVDKSVVEKSITRSVRIRELYKQITGDYAPERPNAPTSPSDKDYTKKTEDYGSYLMSIIKDDYDADKNEWKNKSGDYYDMLKDDDFDGKTASYSTCVKAYKIAYSKYSDKYDAQSKKWEQYTTDLYANTDVHFTNIMPSRSSNSSN